MAKLSADQIAEKFKALPGWEYKQNAIAKMFRFKEYLHGIEFVKKVAEIAEAADHHPDILINYTRVTFSCSTHDAVIPDVILPSQFSELVGARAA